MSLIQSFRDLDVYQAAREQARAILEISATFPTEERYSLTDQIRRSSRTVDAMIAEAWARRRSSAAFINKLNEALGESMETQAWLDHSLDCACIDTEKHKELDDRSQHIGAMLNRMIDSANKFCPPSAK